MTAKNAHDWYGIGCTTIYTGDASYTSDAGEWAKLFDWKRDKKTKKTSWTRGRVGKAYVF